MKDSRPPSYSQTEPANPLPSSVLLCQPSLDVDRICYSIAIAVAGVVSAFCVPPPRPTLPASATTRTSVRKEETGGDGPLVLNAILVVVERYSALKRARFGSETSAAALRGMCVLLCLADGPEEEAEEWGGTIRSGVPKEGGPIPEGESVICAPLA